MRPKTTDEKVVFIIFLFTPVPGALSGYFLYLALKGASRVK
jgi:hypothetical protein